MIEHIPTLDVVLDAHAAALGDDFTGYRNHAYRVVNFCAAHMGGTPGTVDRIALAAAFHDLGIWTAHTFDYLAPSIDLACSHLACTGHENWRESVTGMIREHHKVRKFQGADAEWIEPFRRADWMDVSLGALTFGLPRATMRAIFARWPNAGFHQRLAVLTWRRLKQHPLSPLPVLRW